MEAIFAQSIFDVVEVEDGELFDVFVNVPDHATFLSVCEQTSESLCRHLSGDVKPNGCLYDEGTYVYNRLLSYGWHFSCYFTFVDSALMSNEDARKIADCDYATTHAGFVDNDDSMYKTIMRGTRKSGVNWYVIRFIVKMRVCLRRIRKRRKRDMVTRLCAIEDVKQHNVPMFHYICAVVSCIAFFMGISRLKL
jgi:hypothetical protein